ncbi:hypothetical protein [Aquella oligotrophica]|uniref:Uncharacterized protein n=1 Tax=Aquella oligotrophica TaxID=2067065 RepID=A0A2I7N6K9_9NEIS|nr:hypothetical protein [Aquella oligotrophica]AUR52060.1 hypothetical protein CUN60_07020 [Aquella oligotrophica]
MSQHHFYTTHQSQKTHVLMGWDRPLQGYFMVIEKGEMQDEPYWSNLSQEESHPKTLLPFIVVLEQLNIKIPQRMIIEIMEDGANNAGNKEVIHVLNDFGYMRITDQSNNVNDINAMFLKYASKGN